MGGAEGNFELNAFRPILISNYMHSALIMADMCDHFCESERKLNVLIHCGLLHPSMRRCAAVKFGHGSSQSIGSQLTPVVVFPTLRSVTTGV
jgi:aspartate ammonia-lyase